jgi:sodium transport system permease protein
MLPLATIFNQEGEAAWHLWVPALAQITLMGRVLKGDAMAPVDVLVPLCVSAVLAVACMVYVARTLRRAAMDA